jgi:LysR family transcriptional regulator, low CO2-responsive transcriptional regulator
MRLLGSELTLHKLEVFSTVARLESVTRAAESLHIAQPVVTAHIRSLEAKLGVRLTMRQGRRIRITPDGERVLAWAEDVISRTHELERELTDTKSGGQGSAVIATSMTIGSYVIPSKLVEFRRSAPNGVISVLTGTPRTVFEAIREGRADFGVSILDPLQDVAGLDLEAIGSDELVLVCKPGGKFDRPNLQPKQLETLPFIAAQGNTARRDVEDSALLKIGVARRNYVLEFGHGEAMMRAVRTDVGLAFLFKSSIVEELENRSLKIIPLKDFKIEVAIYLIKRSAKYFSSFQSKLFEFVREGFSSDSQGV